MKVHYIVVLLIFCFFAKGKSECNGFAFNATVVTAAEQKCRLHSSIWDVRPVPSNDTTHFYCYNGPDYSQEGTTLCTSNMTCNGDPFFCSVFPCTLSSPYYCRNQNLIPVRKGDCGFGWLTYDRNSTETVCYTPSSYTPPLYDNYVSSSDIIDLMYEDNKVTVRIRSTSTFDFIKFLFVRQHAFSKPNREIKIFKNANRSIKRSAEEIELNIDSSIAHIYAMTDDSFTSVYSRSYSESQYNLTNDDLCQTGRCEFCESNAQYGFCHVGNFGYVNTAMVLVALFLVICLLPWIVACCTVVIRIGRCLTRPLCVCCNRRSKSSDEIELTSQYEEEDTTGAPDQIAAEDPPFSKDTKTIIIERDREDTPRRNRWKKASRSVADHSNVAMLAIFFLALPLLSNAACTSNIISESSMNSCTRFNSSHSQCSIKPIVTFGLNGVGDEVCITILTNNSMTAGSIKVKFESFVASTILSTQYYTSCWDPVVESSKSCFLESCCTYGSYGSCQDWINAGGEINPCQKFSWGLANIPGVTGCHSYSGCAGNGCFSCANSCNYFRYGFMPKEDVIRVATVGQFIQYTASLKVSSSFSPSIYTVSTQSSSYSEPSGLFSMLLQGVFLDFGITLQKPVAIKSGRVKFVDASPVNAPQVDMIGDIQSPVPNMLSAGTNSFRFNPNLIINSVQSWGTSFTSRGCGSQFFESSLYPPLPTSQSGFIWSYQSSGDKLVADIPRSLTALGTLTFSKPLSFQYLDEAICPKISSLSALGCYSCDEGAIITLVAKSTCYSGSCTVIVPDGYIASTNTVYLSNVDEQKNFTIFSGVANNSNFTLSLKCKDQVSYFTTSFVLTPKIRVDNATNSTNISPPNIPGALDLSGVNFGLDAQWKNNLVLAAIIIGSLIVAIIILILICKFAPCSFCKQDRMSIFKDIVGITAAKTALSTDRFEYRPLMETEKPPQQNFA